MEDVTGEEFELLMSVLGKLSFISTPDGSKELAQLIGQQADLATPFKVGGTQARKMWKQKNYYFTDFFFFCLK